MCTDLVSSNSLPALPRFRKRTLGTNLGARVLQSSLVLKFTILVFFCGVVFSARFWEVKNWEFKNKFFFALCYLTKGTSVFQKVF